MDLKDLLFNVKNPIEAASLLFKEEECKITIEGLQIIGKGITGLYNKNREQYDELVGRGEPKLSFVDFFKSKCKRTKKLEEKKVCYIRAVEELSYYCNFFKMMSNEFNNRCSMYAEVLSIENHNYNLKKNPLYEGIIFPRKFVPYSHRVYEEYKDSGVRFRWDSYYINMMRDFYNLPPYYHHLSWYRFIENEKGEAIDIEYKL